MKIGNRKKEVIEMIRGSLIVVPVIFCLLITYCTVWNDNGHDDSPNSFMKIYDDPSYSHDYYPVDIKWDIDRGGYIILAYTSYPYRPYLLKVNMAGEKEWEKRIGDRYENPIPELHVGQDGYSFFCNISSVSDAALLNVRYDDGLNEEAVFDEVPVKASFISGKGYFLMTANGWKPTFKIYSQDDGEGEAYPYQDECGYYAFRYHLTGKIKDECFYYQTYSRSNMDDETSPCFKLRIPGLDINPYECDINIPFIALMLHTPPVPFSCDDLRVSGAFIRPEEGEEKEKIAFIVNNKIGGVGGIDIINELSRRNSVDIMERNINNKDYVFFVGTTVFNTIKLYAYDKNAPLLQPKIKLFGEDENYYACRLIKTDDNGLAILGGLYMPAGRRICLIKLSEYDLVEMVRGN